MDTLEKSDKDTFVPVFPWIEAYSRELDSTLLENSLKKSIQERLKANEEMNRWFDECQRLRESEAKT